jgi:preprotein translocase subunit YajC
MDYFITTAHAQAAGGATGGPQGTFLILLVVMVGAMYFTVIRPQNKRAKAQQELISKLAAGDEVTTSGGILGKVVEVGDQYLTLEIANGVSIKLQKFQIAQVLPKGTVKNA